ncbi:serine hydrolase [Luteimonas sp. RC10]|uniref:serine hydrolase domain-containing protein n=1 Tax=Luteimonas sp. RC10 TaxID=2587035 RepID=UPI001611A16F|nr:serine hydrolase [Luteimonas sp. RC10]MBB3342549.1 CubicO group peptidase (beta-lactamase class C family) [Luteimonas sp. RC10]
MSILPRLLLLATLACPLSTATASPPALDDGWPVADPIRLGWDAAKLSALDAAITAGAAPDTTSVLIVHRGALIHEAYFDGAERDTLHDTRSLTKSVTALLVGAAIDRGLIADVRTPVLRFFPDRRPAHPGAFKDATTVEDLLTMSAQWECDDNNTFSSGHEERMYVSADWTGFALDLPERGYAPWQTRPADSPYGRAFAYCTANSLLLGAIVERASGMALADFARATLERPLGIAEAAWKRAPEGTGMGGGGTGYRSRDLARLGQLLADGGRWQDRRVLSAAWIDAMLQPRARTPFDADYGYQLWRFDVAAGARRWQAWTMSGNGGNAVFVIPEERLVVVVTRTHYNRPGMHTQTRALLQDYVLSALP